MYDFILFISLHTIFLNSYQLLRLKFLYTQSKINNERETTKKLRESRRIFSMVEDKQKKEELLDLISKVPTQKNEQARQSLLSTIQQKEDEVREELQEVLKEKPVMTSVVNPYNPMYKQSGENVAKQSMIHGLPDSVGEYEIDE